MKEKIMAWLQGPRKYTEGVELYNQFGYNKILKKTYSHGETRNNRESLEYELAKLIGVEKQLNTMQRFASKPEVKTIPMKPVPAKTVYVDDLLMDLAAQFNVSVEDLFSGDGPAMITDEQVQAIERLAPKYNAIPELQKKFISFREKYPFLKDAACPNELKIMVADMFSSYDRYRDAYALLSPDNTQDENLAIAAEVVENYLDNRAMWAELDYYKENNTLLGEHPIFEKLKLEADVKATPDIELNKKLGNARSNVTKNRNKLSVATTEEDKAKYTDLLKHWSYVLDLFEKEVESRKKP